jgi:hypothetical protein
MNVITLARVLHEARRKSLEVNHFRFFEFEQLSQLDRDVLEAQASALLERFDITPKLEVKQ